MKSKLALSDQLYKWSVSYERKINFSASAKNKNADKKITSFRSRFAGIFNRALQALWQARMQVCPNAGAWSEILSVGQQTQTETGKEIMAVEQINQFVPLLDVGGHIDRIAAIGLLK